MEREVVLASHNRKKVRELTDILHKYGVSVLSLDDFPGAPEVEETGETFEENALLKARAVAEYTGITALADDSGLEVDYLGGRPGVYSARFAGEPPDDRKNNELLLSLLDGVPEERRKARFRCAIAIVTPEGREYTVDGRCEGRLAEAPRGTHGFGYDPLFIPEGYSQTFAELGEEIKHPISHRGRALEKAVAILSSM